MVKKAPKGLFPVPPAQYGADYQRHLLDQYKLYVEMANAVSVRRTSANNYFLTINGFLVTLYGLAASVPAGTYKRLWQYLVPLAGLLIAIVWVALITSYRNLNSTSSRNAFRLPSTPTSGTWPSRAGLRSTSRYSWQ